MADHYDDYSKEQLLRLLRERDRRPNFGLVWERDEIDHDRLIDKDPRGPWKAGDLSTRNFYSKGTYPITCPSGRVVAGPPPGNYWRFAEEKLLEIDRDKRIWWGKLATTFHASSDSSPTRKKAWCRKHYGNTTRPGTRRMQKKKSTTFFNLKIRLTFSSRPSQHAQIWTALPLIHDVALPPIKPHCPCRRPKANALR